MIECVGLFCCIHTGLQGKKARKMLLKTLYRAFPSFAVLISTVSVALTNYNSSGKNPEMNNS